MISEIRIQNFKSIRDLAFKPSRVTVLIGENGCGKSNILEAIAFAAGAAASKLDGIFLANRGVRVVEEEWTTSAFPDDEVNVPKNASNRIQLSVKGGSNEPVFDCRIHAKRRKDDGSFDGWAVTAPVWKKEVDEAFQQEEFAKEIEEILSNLKTSASSKPRQALKNVVANDARVALEKSLRRALASSRLSAKKRAKLRDHAAVLGLTDFMVYAPENTTLRTPPPESAIQPLGSKGEGLLKLLQSFSEPKFADRLPDMKARLRMFGWFEDFITPDDAGTAEARLHIRDKWIGAYFDQKSANEGFLYLLFYFTLLMSWRTPCFFALDNVDNALNPKLCSALMRQIAELAKKYDKQVICTTHNPAILDGLNINDDEQRLYTVQRDSEGHTVVNRVHPPKPQPGKPPMKLSAAFLAGHIGGLPEHF